MSDNSNLNKAKIVRDDEFYTLTSDIEKELRCYKEQLREKVVYCNCDTPQSNFFAYFVRNFEWLQLSGVIATGYKKGGKGTYAEYTGANSPIIRELRGDGDFQSPECIEILKRADIVCTNPPFSLLRDYIKTLTRHGAKFLIIAPENAVIYKDIFPFIRDNKIWYGYTKPKVFIMPDGNMKAFGNIIWLTNLEVQKRHEILPLTKRYNPAYHPKYDNYDAIEVSSVNDIPCDYYGVIGVPISFLEKYNPEQFEIVGSNRGRGQEPTGTYGRSTYLGGQETFKRIFIRRRV